MSMSNELMVEDYLINILQVQKEEREKVRALELVAQDHNRRIVELETNVPINAGLNNYLTKLRNRNIVSALGGKNSRAYKLENPEGSQYKKLSTECFKEAERQFKDHFNIRVYAELRQHQYEEAVMFWEEFELSDILKRRIHNANNQVSLFETYA